MWYTYGFLQPDLQGWKESLKQPSMPSGSAQPAVNNIVPIQSVMVFQSAHDYSLRTKLLVYGTAASTMVHIFIFPLLFSSSSSRSSQTLFYIRDTQGLLKCVSSCIFSAQNIHFAILLKRQCQQQEISSLEQDYFYMQNGNHCSLKG